MRVGWTPELEIECRRPDSRVRTFIDAEIETGSDVRVRRSQWQTADGVVLRAHDFPAGNVLDAQGETTQLTLANAPAGNDLYEVHFAVQITPVIPSSGTNIHKVVVAIDTRPAAGAWTERWVVDPFEVVRTAGESGTVVRYPSVLESIRVPGLTSTHEIRLRVKSASGPAGWQFTVHGFNAATDADPQPPPGSPSGAVIVTSSSVANPTVITTAAAQPVSDQTLVRIAGHTGSSPDINGVHRARVTGAGTFTIPVNVTVGGAGGTAEGVVSGVTYHTGLAVDFSDDGGVSLAEDSTG